MRYLFAAGNTAPTSVNYQPNDLLSLAAYDLDKEGEKGIRELVAFTDRMHHAPLPELPEVKDITDFWKVGGNLGDWIARTVEKLDLLSI